MIGREAYEPSISSSETLEYIIILEWFVAPSRGLRMTTYGIPALTRIDIGLWVMNGWNSLRLNPFVSICGVTLGELRPTSPLLLLRRLDVRPQPVGHFPQTRSPTLTKAMK